MKKNKKKSIQIYLDPEQNKILENLSEKSGRSKAAIIRSCITKYIEQLPVENDPAMNLMNLGASDIKNIAEKHDDYLISINNPGK